MLSIQSERLLERIHALGAIGRDRDGKRTRLAASDEDRAGRDAVASWMRQAGLRVVVDRIGNLFGVWETGENQNFAPVMVGSHIDTVIDAGQYDGCYGVLAGIEVVQCLREAGVRPECPLVVAAFTNEEGVRYAPDMMGSLVYAGGMAAKEALASRGTDGTVLGEELKRIGYAGTSELGFLHPRAFLELHIEQGPLLDAEQISIGAVENLQGISWQRVTIEGRANHAGTTPTDMRADAGLAAAKVNVFLRQRSIQSAGGTVCTVGTMALEPNAVNVIPSKAVFTVDMRNPVEEELQREERALADFLRSLERTDHVKITVERMTRSQPVQFSKKLVSLIETKAEKRGLSHRRMTSGAGQDAQMLARICPAAMIFVPSVQGVSHSPQEFTREQDLTDGANVLLDVLTDLVTQPI